MLSKASFRAPVRSIFTRASAMPQVSIAEDFPSAPKSEPTPAPTPKVTASKSPSGLALASDSRFPQIATLGMEIAAGTRVETDEIAGMSQLLAKMAFRATMQRTDLRMFRDVEALGGQVHAYAGRGFVRFGVSVLPENLEEAANLLAETVLEPRFAHYDLALQKQQIAHEIDEYTKDASRNLMEALHSAAFYDDRTLGRPLFDAQSLPFIGSEDLRNFYTKYLTTGNAALVASGVSHETLTDVSSLFADIPQGQRAGFQKATYVGGETRIKAPHAPFTNVAISLPVGGNTAEAEVLSQLLSARLRANGFGKKASGFLVNYEDAGLVGIQGSARSEQVALLVDAMVSELKNAAVKAPSKEELEGAQKAAGIAEEALVSSKNGRMAKLGAMAFTQKTPEVTPESKLAKVTAEQVQKLAQEAVKSKPSVAAIGKVGNVLRVEELQQKLQ